MLQLGVQVEELAAEGVYKVVRWDCPTLQRIQWNQYCSRDFFEGQGVLVAFFSRVGLVGVRVHSEPGIL